MTDVTKDQYETSLNFLHGNAAKVVPPAEADTAASTVRSFVSHALGDPDPNATIPVPPTGELTTDATVTDTSSLTPAKGVLRGVPAPKYHGIDLLGLAKQPVQMIAQNLEPGCMVGFFADQTFGPGTMANFEFLMRSGKLGAFRAHCLWTNHSSPGNAVASIRAIAQQIESIHRRYPKVAGYISPICEYNETNASVVTSWAKACQQAAPSCQVILSPSGTGVHVSGYPSEEHGNDVVDGKGNVKRLYSRSNDGAIFWDSDSASYVQAGSEYVLAWWLTCNLTVSGPPIPPAQRTHPVSQTDILQAFAMFKTPDAKPTGIPHGFASVRELRGKELWKTNSEQGPNPDPRGNRPVFITQIKAGSLDVCGPNGVRIGCLKYYDTYIPYGPGYYRYYSGSCSGDSAYSFWKKAGSEWGYVKNGSQAILVNLLRRTGSFR